MRFSRERVLLTATVVRRRAAKLCLIRAEKGRVVLKAAGGAGVGWGATRDNPLARGQKPLDTDVFSDGGASRLPENAPQLRCAQEKRAADRGQGNVLKKMQIDVLQNLRDTDTGLSAAEAAASEREQSVYRTFARISSM